MQRRATTANRAAIFVPLLMPTICFLSLSESAIFDRLPGYHVTSPVKNISPCCSLSSCAVHCVSSACNGFSFHATNKICHLHDKPIYSQEVTYESSPDWVYMNQHSDFVMYDDWILAFRAAPHINKSTYATWLDPGYDDHPALRHDVPFGCLSVNGSNPCDRHFKSKLVDMWETYNIDQVKMVLYENGVAMNSITFDGANASSTSWFTQSRMISSTWNDIQSGTFTYFSFEGYSDLRWRWFISHRENGESDTIGWMVVLDETMKLYNWHESLSKGYPVFLYGSHNLTVWHNLDYREADVMAVFVKLFR